MPATGDQHNLHSGLVRPANGGEIGGRNLELGVEQSAINVNGDQAERRLHWRDCNLRSREGANHKFGPPCLSGGQGDRKAVACWGFAH